ncbi:MAG: hypothetical protein M1136_08735 [Chloroflexi bacterium]|nr:hypothetical protein [Chloroflexota bacterium]
MEDRVNLSVEIAGHKLRNPLILTEGPLSGRAELIRRAAKHRLGAITTKGIRPARAISPSPYMAKMGKALLNADWSDIGFEQWRQEIRSLDIDVPLIVSIAKNYITPQMAAEFAETLAAEGADMITLCDYNVEELIEAVRLARPRLKVPLLVKLVPFIPNLEEVLKRLQGYGIDALAAMDAVGPGLQIDIDTGLPALGSEDGAGYLSGAAIKPLTLWYIYEISRFMDIPVIAVGGVSTYEDVIEMIMAGATGVGICTAALLNGLEVFDKITADLVKYLEGRGVKDINEWRGLTRKRVRERQVLYEARPVVDMERCSLCRLCLRSCFEGALSVQGEALVIDWAKCAACGLCISVCNRGALQLAGVVGSEARG